MFLMSQSLTLFWPVFSSLRARGNQHLALSAAFTRIQIALSLMSKHFSFSSLFLPTFAPSAVPSFSHTSFTQFIQSDTKS